MMQRKSYPQPNHASYEQIQYQQPAAGYRGSWVPLQLHSSSFLTPHGFNRICFFLTMSLIYIMSIVTQVLVVLIVLYCQYVWWFKERSEHLRDTYSYGQAVLYISGNPMVSIGMKLFIDISLNYCLHSYHNHGVCHYQNQALE
jgi:hypothetical protein